MEKFALLDFLKVFEALSANGDKKKEENTAVRAEKENEVRKETAPMPAPVDETPNVMASVLSRHEEISNRIKNKR